MCAALGHLINSDHKSVKALVVMDYWLGYLPIKKDKAEAKEQHEFLVKWFRIDSPAFNPATNDGLHRIVKILRVFAELYNTKKMVTSSLKK